MEIDVQIERISNGFIVTGNDSTRTKQYYPSMESFVEDWVIDPIKDADKYFKEHNADGEIRRFKLKVEAA
ncbi:hypothetical protein SAMN03080615_01617 [Amphritea atlantica]|uniref:Uncharacterized protein n=1 Tax=Amphritea atlantica TaxID=355243 RepID=A0A1H9GDA0_9GAMM|nr:hypothetical protein [Amphritea atlantica]SEQ48059.1 hypothetical protein SAMN03080615_01617 [Amphritea atlantica]